MKSIFIIWNSKLCPSHAEIISDAEATFYQRSREQKRYYQAVAQDDHPVWQELQEVLKTHKPDLVGVTLLSVEVATSRRSPRLSKPGIRTVGWFGGGEPPHFSPHGMLKGSEVDVVCRGEGEYTLLELCENISKGKTDFSGIEGLSITHQNEVRHNPSRLFDREPG